MKYNLFFLPFFLSATTQAQTGLEAMISAEKSFAAYAVAHSTQEAFVKFADTGAVMFSKGEPLNGYQLWLKREKQPGILAWRPRYAEIAASGNFGYTTGPWTFQPKTTADSIVANGYFFTVWKKNAAGEWKFLLDVGAESGPMLLDTAVIKPTVPKQPGTPTAMLQAEAAFISLYKRDSVKAYRQFLSPTAVTTWQQTGYEKKMVLSPNATPNTAGQIQFAQQGSGMAPSNDMGFVYGSASLAAVKETYLRIWRHEKEGWKIAVQLIRL